MKERISFILGLHNHQPVGNFPHVFREAYKKAYKPFIDEILCHPEVKVTLHYTGSLYQWILKEEPEFMEVLRELISRGQAEIMGGGFYEPVLPVIPEEDRRGQIKRMTDFIQEHLGAKVRGLWLAERIWEPHLVKSLAETGIEYLVVDDYHFKRVGFSEEECTGYYISEEEGRSIKIFPISERLRYLVPFQDPCKSIAYMKKMATLQGDRALVLADDGEKFGSWPETYQAVYEEGWLAEFFDLLKENSSWLETLTFGEYLDSFPCRGTLYLPTCSYREMMEWSGGFWRNYMVRYPESNQIHKRMLMVHQKVYQITDPSLRNQALDHLWAGQSNCGYWHGVFGGLYLNFLRHALYRNLIRAQVLAEKELYPQDEWLEIQEGDFLYDGQGEVALNTRELGIYVSPHKGGSLYAFDYKPRSFNIMDTLTRRREPYHKTILDLMKKDREVDICKEGEGPSSRAERGKGEGVKTIHEIAKVKEKGLEKHLIYDKYQRLSLLDHFLDPGETLDNFKRGIYKEKGNYIMEPYNYSLTRENKKALLALWRDGRVKGYEKKVEVSLRKELKVEAGASLLEIVYKIKNQGGEKLVTRFAIEFNYGFLSGYAPDRYYYASKKMEENHLASSGEISGINYMGIKDEWQKMSLHFTFDRPTNLWRFPLETVSQSEGGFERTYQGSVLIPFWDLELSPDEEGMLKIKKEIIPD